MNGGPRYSAFLGDPARKAALVEQIRTRWQAGQVFPLPYLKWRTDGGMVSLAGALAQTQVPEEFIERTGLPVELATLCESLVYSGAEFREDEGAPWGMAIRGAEPVLAFAMEWLEAVPVGADLGLVVPRFMHAFLAGILAPEFAMAAHLRPALRASAERILGQWERELNDQPVTAKEWRSVRAEALRASEDQSDPWGFVLAEGIESLAWPVKGLAAEFVPIFQVFMKELRQFLVTPFLSSEDREIVTRSLVGLRALSRAQRDPQLSQLPTELLLKHDPPSQRAVQALMNAQTQARLDVARRQAQALLDRSMREQMDRLCRLIQAAGRPQAAE